MNRSVLARIGPVLFAFYAIAYAAFFAWGLVRFSNETYLTIFTTEVAARQAFLDLLAWIVPITAGAVVTALSLAAGSAKRGGPALPFNQIVASTVVTFLVLAAGFTALSETLGAGSSRRLDELAWQSRLAREYEKLAVKARDLGDWSRAAEYDRLYLRIDTENRIVEDHRTTDEANAERARAEAGRPPRRRRRRLTASTPVRW